jgi:GT2 family glycosyltransferase
MQQQSFKARERSGEAVAGTRRPRVSIVVLNWNGREVLEDCLRSVHSLHYAPFEVIVVDNGSKDGSVEMVQRSFPECVLIQNKENLGFAKGNNQGIVLGLERSNDYVMVLNNDTLVAPEFLTCLVERAESDPRIAAVSPKIYFAEPSDRVWFAGGTFSYWKGRNRHVGYRQKDCQVSNVPREVQFVSGCVLLGSRRAWQEVGGFDESLFAYGEDLEWSLRAQKLKFKLFYEPRAVVWHRESFSTLRNGWQASQAYYSTRNPMVVMWKRGRWWHWLTFLPYHAAVSCKRIAQALSRGDWLSVVKIVQGFRDFSAVARQANTQRSL